MDRNWVMQVRKLKSAIRRAGTRWLLLAQIAMRRSRQYPERDVPVVVSLTSFPPRIRSTAWAIESILRQHEPADQVVLVLCSEEFPERRLPYRIERQKRRGLEVLWIDQNLRSYKKLLPALDRYPEAVIVTVDDDVLYPPGLLGRLVEEHKADPEAIIGTRGRRIEWDASGRPSRYNDWQIVSREMCEVDVMLTGVGGILYPPGSLSPQASDYTLAAELSPTADDIWFWAMSRMAGTPVRCVGDGDMVFYSMPSSARSALSAANVSAGRNDRQLFRVMDHFGLT